jgi:hypothetical protein
MQAMPFWKAQGYPFQTVKSDTLALFTWIKVLGSWPTCQSLLKLLPRCEQYICNPSVVYTYTLGPRYKLKFKYILIQRLQQMFIAMTKSRWFKGNWHVQPYSSFYTRKSSWTYTWPDSHVHTQGLRATKHVHMYIQHEALHTYIHTHTRQSPYCAGNYLSVVWPCECPVINCKSMCIVTISLLICPWFTQHAIWLNACHKTIGETGWDLNPRPSAYTPNALTYWANLGVDTLACLNGVFYIMHHMRHVRFTCIHVR